MKSKNKSFLLRLIPLLIFSLLFSTSCKNKYADLGLEVYEYQDTKELIKFVYDAAKRFENGGLDELKYFMNNRDFYKGENYYLYIYKMDGTMHPGFA